MRRSPRSRSVSTSFTTDNLHRHGLFNAFSIPVLSSHSLCIPHLQNVIPQQLLDQYLSMTDPARAQTVDTEIAKHCAFSLPGVALTLGRQNWHCLKDTYETLATDVQVGRERGNSEGRFVFTINTMKTYSTCLDVGA